jgi:hypothetical protein
VIIRTPSSALRKRIRAIGDAPIIVVTVYSRTVKLSHPDGSELSEPEQRRVAGLIAADDAEPFK